jgi:hypothetical protein
MKTRYGSYSGTFSYNTNLNRDRLYYILLQ